MCGMAWGLRGLFLVFMDIFWLKGLCFCEWVGWKVCCEISCLVLLLYDYFVVLLKYTRMYLSLLSIYHIQLTLEILGLGNSENE
jgi:hypothetical protein